MSICRSLVIIIAALLCGNSLAAQELMVDVPAVKKLISKWNSRHTINTVGNLSSLYSDTVDFYGSVLKRQSCVSLKRVMLEKQKDFSQILKTELVLSGYSSGAIRCDFVKTVSRNSKMIDYKSYLIVKRINEIYYIIGESDLITDHNIKHEPDLGRKITIKDGRFEVRIPVRSKQNLTSIIGTLLLIALVGLVFVYRSWKKNNITKIPTPVANQTTGPKAAWASTTTESIEYEKGLAFEKFIVEQFAVNRNRFTLQEWRSDKFHEGIYPQSNHDPDLEYKFTSGNFVRTFSIECKYRSKSFNNSITLMDENKYKIYKTFHKNKMPVYIALGLGGIPSKPAELFLIPFNNVKPEMAISELSAYRKQGSFVYNILKNRLT